MIGEILGISIHFLGSDPSEQDQEVWDKLVKELSNVIGTLEKLPYGGCLGSWSGEVAILVMVVIIVIIIMSIIMSIIRAIIRWLNDGSDAGGSGLSEEEDDEEEEDAGVFHFCWFLVIFYFKFRL